MSDSVIGLSIYMMPGMKIEIAAPINGRNSQGFFARRQETEPLPDKYWADAPNASDELIRGFAVEDETVGKIVASSQSESSVVYTHNQPYINSIWFFARTGERGLVKVISVPIHDHSTIIHGGPAYGTYYDDDLER